MTKHGCNVTLNVNANFKKTGKVACCCLSLCSHRFILVKFF